MESMTQLEKLHELKEKGILTEEEFQSQKKVLLQRSEDEATGPKYQAVYVVLALCFGLLGVHNFYIGRWKRGLAQLLINLFTLFLGVIITYPWSVINVFAIRTDGKGRPLKPAPIARIICGVFMILGLLWWLFTLIIMFVGAVSGYTHAMSRYHANEIANYAQMVQVTAATKNISSEISCSQLLEMPPTIEEGIACVAHPDGSVVLSGMDRAMAEGVARAAQTTRVEDDNVIIAPIVSH